MQARRHMYNVERPAFSSICPRHLQNACLSSAGSLLYRAASLPTAYYGQPPVTVVQQGGGYGYGGGMGAGTGMMMGAGVGLMGGGEWIAVPARLPACLPHPCSEPLRTFMPCSFDW